MKSNRVFTSGGITATVYGTSSGKYTTITRIDIDGMDYYTGRWANGAACPLYIEVGGVRYTPGWTVDAVSGSYVKKAHCTGSWTGTWIGGDVLDITLSVYTSALTGLASWILWGQNVVFYDIENAPSSMYASGGEMDGTTNSTVEIYQPSTGAWSADATYNLTVKTPAGGWVQVTRVSKAGIATKQNFVMPKDSCKDFSSVEYGQADVAVTVKYGDVTYKTITCKLDVHVPSSYKPSISAITLADSMATVPAAWKSFVQYYSGIKLTAMTAEPSHGSSIKSVLLEVGDQSATGTQIALPYTKAVGLSGALTCTVTVTDARGRQASKSATVNFLAYSPPSIDTITSTRCGSSGSADNDGVYFNAYALVDFASCAGLNKLTITAAYKLTSATSYGAAKTIKTGGAVCGGDLDTECSYDVQYIIKDQFNTIQYIDYVSTAVYCMHFLHGGRGVAFGQMATVENTADFAFDAVYRNAAEYRNPDEVRFIKANGQVVTASQILAKLGL